MSPRTLRQLTAALLLTLLAALHAAPLTIFTNGKIVTAYYSKAVENHDRYHMGVAIWEVPEAK